MKSNKELSGPSSGLMTIAFVGGGLEVSGCYARAIDAEIPGVKLETFDDVDAFLNAGIDSSVQLIIVKASHHAQLANRQTVINARFPHKIICLAYDDKNMLLGSIDATARNSGLRSFLPMNMRLDIWLAAIRLMLSGGSYMPGDVMRMLDDNNATKRPSFAMQSAQSQHLGPKHSICRLTSRETEVLKLVSEGQQNKNVAAELGLSEHTIKLHMHHIFSKLGVSNRTQAAAMFQKEAVY